MAHPHVLVNGLPGVTLAHLKTHFTGEFGDRVTLHANTRTCPHWRSNGKLRTWKRNPDRFELPVKYGLYTYGTITEHNAHNFHCECECPYSR